MTAVRSYIAGTGAAGALVGAAAVAFALLTALVAFNGFPIDTAGSGAQTVNLTSSTAKATRAVATPAALALGGAPGAVAATPVAPPATAATTAALDPGTSGGPVGTQIPPDGTPITTVDPSDPTLPGEPSNGGNPVQNVAGGVDQVVQQRTGLDPNLSGVTAPITNVVDNTLQALTGKDLGETVSGLGLQNPLNGHPLVGEPGTGIAGTGLLP